MASKFRGSYALWLLAGISLLALAVRLYCLDCYSLWGDEISSIEVAQRGVAAIFNDRFGWMRVQTPLHYLAVWLTLQPVDATTTAALVRLPSALAGALTVPVVYLLGRELFSRLTGLLGALFVALSAVHLGYSQDARPYAFLTLLTALSVYSLLVAERTGEGRWWLAFAASTTLNILNAYFALTLVMPALAPYLLWVAWRLFARRSEGGRPLLYGLASFGVSGAVGLFMLLDMMQVPRIPPDLSRFVNPLELLSRSSAFALELMVWFTQYGLGARADRLLAMLLLILALVGLYGAVRTSHWRGVALCLLFVLVPSAILAVLSTTNVVFQRYALFVLPFYFLLLGNGIATVASLRDIIGSARPSIVKPARVAGITIGTLAALLFLMSTYGYFTPEGHAVLSYRPDFRSAARYLAERATERDTIIFADDPALGFSVAQFYWRNTPPATVYDARDPRLFTHKPAGNVYWVVSMIPPVVAGKIASPEQGWAETRVYERVAILREDRPGDILPSMEGLVSKLEAITLGNYSFKNYQPVRVLRGGIQQAKGDAAAAAETYRRANTYFPVGEEYLRTAEGFASIGDDTRAWREAFLSKFCQPERPGVHLWLAKRLRETGYEEQSRIEAEIARVLEAASAASAGKQP